MAGSIAVRPLTDDDINAVTACIADHQDYHRALEPDWPAGADIAARHLAYLQAECVEYHGRIFVAVDDSTIAGFVCVVTDKRGSPDDPTRHAFVHDLFVAAEYRRRGIAARLMEAAEAFARSAGVAEIRLAVLEHNADARWFYASRHFRDYARVLKKTLW
jgi:ribosomal protein S18 acetylase RimI-like enzyme